MAGTRLSIRIDLASGDRIGPGKIALLEAIRSTGSISAAARSLGMSYRRAWLLVEEVNDALREPGVTAETGGRRGGGAMLTSAAGCELTRGRRITKNHLKSWIKSRKFRSKCSVPAGASELIVRSLYDRSGAIFPIRGAA